MVAGLLKTQVTMPARWQYLVGLGQKALYPLNQHLMCGPFFPIAKIHKSRNEEVEMEMEPLIIVPGDPPAKFLMTSGSRVSK